MDDLDKLIKDFNRATKDEKYFIQKKLVRALKLDRVEMKERASRRSLWSKLKLKNWFVR